MVGDERRGFECRPAAFLCGVFMVCVGSFRVLQLRPCWSNANLFLVFRQNLSIMLNM